MTVKEWNEMKSIAHAIDWPKDDDHDEICGYCGEQPKDHPFPEFLQHQFKLTEIQPKLKEPGE